MELNYFNIIPVELVSIILVYLDDYSIRNIGYTYEIFKDIIDSELFRINKAIFKYKDYHRYMKYLKSNNIKKFFDIEYKTRNFISHFRHGSLQNNYRYSIELNANVDRNINLKDLVYNDIKDFEKIFKNNTYTNLLQINFGEYGYIIKFKSDPIFMGSSLSEHEFLILILKLYLVGIDVSHFKKFT